MKLKAKTKEYRLILTVKMSSGENIDEKELDRFSRAYLRGFLKPALIKNNRIEYTGPIGISLQERLKKPISKRDFYFIMEQLVVAVQRLHANQMPIKNLIMNMQNTYINEVTKEVQFLYVPLKESGNSTNMIEFIETIIYSVNPTGEKDSDYISRFVYYFQKLSPFDINKIEKYILHEDKSVVDTIKKYNTGQSGYITDKHQHYYEHYDVKNNSEMDTGSHKLPEEDDEATGLLEEDEATGLLEDENTTSVIEEDEATGLLEEDDTSKLLEEDDEATGLLVSEGANESGAMKQQAVYNVHFPTLLRVMTEETININKPVYRIGKERSYVDYFVTNNIAVSRSHADIITRSNKYYIKDLNSKNHTFINDQEVPVMCEVELRDGDRLRLANEEFIFKL